MEIFIMVYKENLRYQIKVFLYILYIKPLKEITCQLVNNEAKKLEAIKISLKGLI